LRHHDPDDTKPSGSLRHPDPDDTKPSGGPGHHDRDASRSTSVFFTANGIEGGRKQQGACPLVIFPEAGTAPILVARRVTSGQKNASPERSGEAPIFIYPPFRGLGGELLTVRQQDRGVG
jgi:hypothetical protein